MRKPQSKQTFQTQRYEQHPEFRAKLKQQVKKNYLKRYNFEDIEVRNATRERKKNWNKAFYLRANDRNEDNGLTALEFEKLK